MRTTFTVNSQKSHGSCTSFSQRTTDSNTLAKKKERKTHTQCRQHTLLRACAYETLSRITTHSKVVHKKTLCKAYYLRSIRVRIVRFYNFTWSAEKEHHESKKKRNTRKKRVSNGLLCCVFVWIFSCFL